NFQQAKLELEKKLEEKNEKIKELALKLKESEGEIRHLKLLSVVRNAQKANPLSVDAKDKENLSVLDNYSKNSKEIGRTAVENGENNCMTSSIIAAARNGSNVQGNKGVKKRKLYSKVTFACPEEILY
ncbi:hypothetical protein Anas_06252, partial [Armadillidium nasatum]